MGDESTVDPEIIAREAAEREATVGTCAPTSDKESSDVRFEKGDTVLITKGDHRSIKPATIESWYKGDTWKVKLRNGKIVYKKGGLFTKKDTDEIYRVKKFREQVLPKQPVVTRSLQEELEYIQARIDKSNILMNKLDPSFVIPQ